MSDDTKQVRYRTLRHIPHGRLQIGCFSDPARAKQHCEADERVIHE